MCKNLGVTPDYVINEMTYENVLMYSHATPSYDPDEKDREDSEEKAFDPSKDANNPDNFKDEEDDIVTDLRTLHRK